MIHRMVRVGFVGVLLFAGVAVVRAEDDEATPKEAPLETRLYAVEALVTGTSRHTADRGPFAVMSDQVNDEQHPIFGSESEEPARLLPEGDLLELVKSSVGTPGTWEQEGVSLQTVRNQMLLARIPAAEQGALAEYLAGEARRVLATSVVDVALLAGDPAGLRAGGLAEAVAARRVRVLGLGRALVRPGGCSVARDGSLSAFLQDADVEVAEDARVPDPIVGVVPDGIACEVEVVASPAGRAIVRVRGWWSAPPTMTTYRTKEQDVLELPSTDGRSFDATLDLEQGAWGLAPLTEGVVLAVRARTTAPAIAAAEGAGEPFGAAPSGAPMGPLALRAFDVSALSEHVADRRGVRLAVVPSNYTPPEPPELREPRPVFPTEALVDLIKSRVEPASWEQEGVSLDARSDQILVRNDATRLDAIQRALDALRAERTRTTRVRVSLVTLPVTSLPEYWTGLEDALVADGGEALRSRPGARFVDTLGLRLRDGQRLASVSGTMRQYVGDFDVEIAVKSVIANPIVKSVLDGTSLDVWAAPVGRGAEIALELRLERGTVREMRNATSMHGPIQCPVYGLLRCLGAFTIPSGSTRIAGASSSGGDVTLVLVTATRE
ncbi:MAG TPA: hypothetical protein VND21_00635 [Planctomycetota bacterium]|nr:hypothetical protein [Planctomycetota bacterium]